MKISDKEIISSTDIIKNYKACRDKTKELSRTVIFKNNSPDLVLLDINEYKRLHDIAEELEHIEIYNMIKKRIENDNGKRYSLDEVAQKFGISIDDESYSVVEVEKIEVTIDDNIPEYMNGILRVGSVIAYYLDGTTEEFEQLVDNTEYCSKQDIIKNIAQKLEASEDIIKIV